MHTIGRIVTISPKMAQAQERSGDGEKGLGWGEEGEGVKRRGGMEGWAAMGLTRCGRARARVRMREAQGGRWWGEGRAGVCEEKEREQAKVVAAHRQYRSLATRGWCKRDHMIGTGFTSELISSLAQLRQLASIEWGMKLLDYVLFLIMIAVFQGKGKDGILKHFLKYLASVS
jgi:hypothetical protein